jgi:hypothetical protein
MIDASESVMPGRTGAINTPVGIPAALMVRNAFNLAAGGGVPGSAIRQISGSSVVIEK